MNDDEILAAVIESINQETGNDSLKVTLNTTASDVPGWDSLAHIRILLDLGDRLGVSINIEETYRAASIGDLIPMIRRSPRA